MTTSDVARINALLISCKGRCCLCLEEAMPTVLGYVELPENGELTASGHQASEVNNLIPLCLHCSEESKVRKIPEGQRGTAFTANELKGHKSAAISAFSK